MNPYTEFFETGLDGSEVSRRYMKAARDMQKNEIFATFYLAEVEKRRFWHEQGYSSVIHFAVETGGITESKRYLEETAIAAYRERNDLSYP